MTQPRTYYWLGLAVAGFTALFLVWAVGALGIVGDGGPPDLLYLGALAVGVVGTLLARFRASGMARAFTAAAVVTLLAPIAVVVGDLLDGASALDLLGLTAMYAGLFGAAAWLFHRAARETAPA
jgi:hypothetical protein